MMAHTLNLDAVLRRHFPEYGIQPSFRVVLQRLLAQTMRFGPPSQATSMAQPLVSGRAVFPTAIPGVPPD